MRMLPVDVVLKRKFKRLTSTAFKKVSDIIDSNADDRACVVITCDGLPYKQAVSIIQNDHSCVTCGERLKYATELSSHKSKTGLKQMKVNFIMY